MISHAGCPIAWKSKMQMQAGLSATESKHTMQAAFWKSQTQTQVALSATESEHTSLCPASGLLPSEKQLVCNK